MQPTVRRAGPEDVETLARLANALDIDQGGEGTNFSAEVVLRDGFGQRPAYRAFLVEIAGEAAGYAMVADLYNTDLAAWGLWLCDLYVDPAHRRMGAAHALMVAIARDAQARGAKSVWWGAYRWNRGALDFYRAIGAKDDNAAVLELAEAAIEALGSGGGKTG